MRRSAICVIACFVALAALASSASAAGNGMLAAVSEGKLITLNPDGSGVRTVWAPPSGEITALAWSPDGNKLALIYGDRLTTLNVVSGERMQLKSDGFKDADPLWLSDGAIGIRRIGPSGQSLVKVKPDLSEFTTVSALDLGVASLAWAPTEAFAITIGGSLFSSTVDLFFPLVSGVVGTPAWSPEDGTALAYVASGSDLPPVEAGLHVMRPVSLGSQAPLVAAPPVASPRWSPDAQTLAYIVDGAIRTVPAAGTGGPTTIPGTAKVTAVDWQPCKPGLTGSCESIAPPTCDVLSLTATTQTDQPVDLPAPPCKDPASRGLSVVMVRNPEHGSLVGQTYTPAPGYVGQDELAYKVTNGSGDSPVVTVKIFVVPRPSAQPAPGAAAAPVPRVAPYLTAKATPRLDSRRATTVRVGCDQDCAFEIRLTATLKKGKKKTVKSSLVKRTLASGNVLQLKLRLPAKPKGKLKSAFMTGIVRNTAGQERPVKLPVRLPR